MGARFLLFSSLLLACRLALSQPSCTSQSACFPTSQDDFEVTTGCRAATNASASSTCGQNASEVAFDERFCVGDALGSSDASNCSHVCNADDPLLRHPPEYAIDGDDSTAWQSSVSEQGVIFTLALPRLLLLASTTMVFRSLPPHRMALEGSSDGGKTWRRLQLWASVCRRPEGSGGYNMSTTTASELEGNLNVACLRAFPSPIDEAEVRLDLRLPTHWTKLYAESRFCLQNFQYKKFLSWQAQCAWNTMQLHHSVQCTNETIPLPRCSKQGLHEYIEHPVTRFLKVPELPDSKYSDSIVNNLDLQQA